MKCLRFEDSSLFTLEKLRSAHPLTICMIYKNDRYGILQKSFIDNIYQVSSVVKEYEYELQNEDDTLLKMISENKILSGELYPYFENYKKSPIYGIVFLLKPIVINIGTSEYTITHLIFSQNNIDNANPTLLAIDVQYLLLDSIENNNSVIIANLKLEQRNNSKKLLTLIMIKDSISIFDGYGRELLEDDEYNSNIVDTVDIYENLAIYYAPRNTLGKYELKVPGCYANDRLSSEISFTNFAYVNLLGYPQYSLNLNDPIKIRNIMKKIKSPNTYTDTLLYIYRFSEVINNADIVFYGDSVAYFSEDLRYYGLSILYNTDG